MSEPNQPIENKPELAKESHSSAETQPIVIQQKSSGKGLATLALFLSLGALGASGFLFQKGQNVLNLQDLRLQESLNQAALGDSKNAQLLQNALVKQNDLNQNLDVLRRTTQENQMRLDNTNAAYRELLKGRVDWLVNEVEVTLNLAAQQLFISGNIPVTIAVLESIEQRLNRFEQPDLLPIKQAITQDLTNLKSRPYLNISGAALKLDRLESSVTGLPLLLDSRLKETPTAPADQSKAPQFWQRAWENSVTLLKGMVEIRNLENNDAMLMAPEQIYFVKENLRLRLLDARIALLQNNSQVYQNDLNVVEATIKQYFDVQSPVTVSWLEELNGLKNLDLRMISDDVLKASQTAIRHYQQNAQANYPIQINNESLPALVTVETATASQVVAPDTSIKTASEAEKAKTADPKTETAQPSESVKTENSKPTDKTVEAKTTANQTASEVAMASAVVSSASEPSSAVNTSALTAGAGALTGAVVANQLDKKSATSSASSTQAKSKSETKKDKNASANKDRADKKRKDTAKKPQKNEKRTD